MASSSASRGYDVFLSFRGLDTRHSIVSHLYAALDSRGLYIFKDDKRLEIGDYISAELRRAIQGSDFVVVVLSENYATSRWCLMELQLIMELQRQGRLSVLPVFYGVEPSAVRHQLRSFDLERYQRDPKTADKVPMWREALTLIADLSGVESKPWTDEATMVGNIAEDISRRKTLKRRIDGSNNIVGAETHMQCLKSLLDMNSENDEVRMIGIWGMGGIGKTTIANCLYDKISFQFEATCFTKDVKGIHRDLDLQLLQKELLYETLTFFQKIRLRNVKFGREEIKARLGRKKVLLVLDGVDKIGQVHALAKETSWFGPGSRIIITTRDRGLLNSCGVETIYEVKCLDDEDSLKMFKQIAFEGRSPPFDDFEQLSIRAARLAHGLPSALEAYALCLRERAKSPEEWEAAVCGLENAPEEKIKEILKLSYLDLGQEEKDVFLEVACLFNGETYQRVISLLIEGYGHRKGEIRVLAEKSLINITTSGYVILHKLVEQMGKKIMLDCRKFIGHPKKIENALVRGDGTKDAECISLHICEMIRAFSIRTSVFERMHCLKFIKVYKHVNDRKSSLQVIQDKRGNCSSYTHDTSDLSIRLIHWDAFPLKTFPLKIDPSLLVELNLRHSDLETIWNHKLYLPNLKKLDVTGSKNLKRLPDLSSSKNLEELLLEQCKRLKGIPESIGDKTTLRRLSLSYNGGPKNPMGVVIWQVSGTKHIALKFPTAKVEMELMNISIDGDIHFHFSSGCEGYAEYFSLSSEQHIPVTTTMSVQQTTQLISEFKTFEALNIRRFNYKEDGPPVTFHSFLDILSLKELKVVNLNIQNLPDGIGHLKHLEKLDLSGNDFQSLPEALSNLSRLKTLWLRNCSKLKELPELSQVQSLTLFNCRNLRSLVKGSAPDRYCLLELCLDNCKNVNSLSDQLSHFTKLTYLDLSNHDFETLPSSVTDLTLLVTLCLNNCKNLKSVEELPLSLQFLYAQGCDSLEADALKHFEERLNKKAPEQPQSACFQETDSQSFKRGRRATKSRLPKFLSRVFLFS